MFHFRDAWMREEGLKKGMSRISMRAKAAPGGRAEGRAGETGRRGVGVPGREGPSPREVHFQAGQQAHLEGCFGEFGQRKDVEVPRPEPF